MALLDNLSSIHLEAFAEGPLCKYKNTKREQKSVASPVLPLSASQHLATDKNRIQLLLRLESPRKIVLLFFFFFFLFSLGVHFLLTAFMNVNSPGITQNTSVPSSHTVGRWRQKYAAGKISLVLYVCLRYVALMAWMRMGLRAICIEGQRKRTPVC